MKGWKAGEDRPRSNSRLPGRSGTAEHAEPGGQRDDTAGRELGALLRRPRLFLDSVYLQAGRAWAKKALKSLSLPATCWQLYLLSGVGALNK